MDDKLIWTIVIVLLGVAGAGAYFYFTRGDGQVEPQPRQEQVLPPPPPPTAQEETPPPILHPVPPTDTPEEQPGEPLPTLNESDPVVQEQLRKAAGPTALESFLVQENLIRRFVATVDNLPTKKVADRLRPVKPIPGQLVVTGDADAGERVTLSPENYARYTTFVKAVQAADTRQLVAVYLRFYPLLQQAYEDLGYPDRYFNDRVVEVIDHLLATPQVREPIELVRPNVLYEFADPQLEALSAGQKALIRMGPQNAAVIKQKLKEIRAQITHPSSAPQGAGETGTGRQARPLQGREAA